MQNRLRDDLERAASRFKDTSQLAKTRISSSAPRSNSGSRSNSSQIRNQPHAQQPDFQPIPYDEDQEKDIEEQQQFKRQQLQHLERNSGMFVVPSVLQKLIYPL